jgi:hypothetical protein
MLHFAFSPFRGWLHANSACRLFDIAVLAPFCGWGFANSASRLLGITVLMSSSHRLLIFRSPMAQAVEGLFCKHKALSQTLVPPKTKQFLYPLLHKWFCLLFPQYHMKRLEQTLRVSLFYLSIYLSIHPSIYPSIYLFMVWGWNSGPHTSWASSLPLSSNPSWVSNSTKPGC